MTGVVRFCDLLTFVFVLFSLERTELPAFVIILYSVLSASAGEEVTYLRKCLVP